MTTLTLYSRCADAAIFRLAAVGITSNAKVELIGKGVRLQVGSIVSPLFYSFTAFRLWVDALQEA